MTKKSIRALWSQRLANGPDLFSNTQKPSAPLLPTSRSFTGIVMGIDPSLRGTGVAIIDFKSSNHYQLLHTERITCPPKIDYFHCLQQNFLTISQLCQKYSIQHAALEQTIYVQNHRVSYILGSVKGAIIAALMQYNLSINEYEPLRIKQAVTGNGRASKEQIQQTIKLYLNVTSQISFDESDAAAAAFCHAWTIH